MKNNDIKEMIKESFSKETPNIISKIKTQCDFVDQKEIFEVKKEKFIFGNLIFKTIAFAMIACVLFVCGIFIGGLSNQNLVLSAKTSIFLDVNPSLEIKVDENDKVVECIANNNDAEKILENLSLEGIDVNTAIYAIVGSMYANGYITKNKNSILVSIENTNDETIVLENIVKQIENIFKNNEDMDCSIIGQEIPNDEQLKEKAKQFNISVGKMRLIEKIINQSIVFEEKNIEELVEMSIHELNLLYQSSNKENNEHEYVSGKPGGFKNIEEMLDYICESLGVAKDTIESHEIYTLYHHNNKFERELIYLVKIKIKGEFFHQKYIFNSVTGELLTEDALEDWKDKFDDFDKPLNENDYKETLDKIEKELNDLYSKIHSSLFSKDEIKHFKELYDELLDEYEDLIEDYDESKKHKNH